MIEQIKIPADLIIREDYSDKIKNYLDKNIIKVITGQRRTGKSYLMYQIISIIYSQNTDAQIIYINKELSDFRFIRNDADLIEYLDSYQLKDKNYVFIDEIQEIKGFEQALRSLLATHNWDIWCTGSNASFLSKDIAGLLSGRSIEIRVYPLTYSEFLLFHKLTDSDNSLNSYLKYGGLPYLTRLKPDDATIFEYLKSLYSTILFKDIVARHNIRNINFLENLVNFAAGNIGSLFSANSISMYLKSEGLHIPPIRVIEYLSYLEDAFFLIKLKRADIKGKKIFNFGEKYFFEDLGLRNSISGFRFEDMNKVIENAILLHLRSQDFKVFTGQNESNEIDFIAEKNDKRIYFQVAYQIPDQKVYEREFGNLKKIRDNYPKYVISMDPVKWDDDMGIKHFQLREFLTIKL